MRLLIPALFKQTNPEIKWVVSAEHKGFRNAYNLYNYLMAFFKELFNRDTLFRALCSTAADVL